MNKYTNIRRKYNIKMNYYKIKKDWNIEKFNLKVKRNLKKLKH